MNVNLLRQTMAVSALGLIFLLGMSGIAVAQNNRQSQKSIDMNDRSTWKNDDRQKDYEGERRERERYESLERLRLQSEYYRQDILEQQWIDVERIEQFREEQRLKNQGNRYRIYLDGKEYQMNYDGSELLKQAVNVGYQDGFNNQKQFGKLTNGIRFISDTVLQGILNLEQF